MTCKVLIVEDEIFVAIEVQSVVSDLGLVPVGIAADSRRALELGKQADLALVDFNLRDGPTGAEVGRRLAASGTSVMFVTANPTQLGAGVPGALGVLAKPVNDRELRSAIEFLAATHRREPVTTPPRRLKLFDLPPEERFAARPSG